MPEQTRVPIAHPTLPGRVYHAAASTVAGWRQIGWLLVDELDEDSDGAPGRVYHAAASTVAGWRQIGWLLVDELDEDSDGAPASDDASHDITSAPDGTESSEQD